MALDIDALEAAARERLDPGAYDFFATTVLGTAVAFPVLAAPVAVLSLAHPDGERAVAAAAAAAGTLHVVSSRTSTAPGEVAAAAPRAPWWFQVYVMRGRGLTAELVARAVEAGAGALVLTGDTPRVGRKRRHGPDFDVPVEVHMPDLARGEDLRGDPRLDQDAGTSLADIAGEVEESLALAGVRSPAEVTLDLLAR